MEGRYCLTVGNRFTRQSASGCVGKHVGQHTHDPSGQLASRSLHTAESFCRISDCLRESLTSRFWSSKDTTMYSIYMRGSETKSRRRRRSRRTSSPQRSLSPERDLRRSQMCMSCVIPWYLTWSAYSLHSSQSSGVPKEESKPITVNYLSFVGRFETRRHWRDEVGGERTHRVGFGCLPIRPLKVSLQSQPAKSAKSASMSLNPSETPLNAALLLAIAYYVRQLVLPSASVPKTLPSEHSKGYNWMPATHPDVSVFKTYTPKTLEPFNGKDGSKILLAIDRKVFDVTAGRNFYGPGTYHPSTLFSRNK